MGENEDAPSLDAESEGRAVPVNADPEIFGYALQLGVDFLQSNGWYIVLAAAVLAFLWSKFQPALQRIRRGMAGASDSDLLSDADSETIQARSVAMDAARRRLQEQHDATAAKYAEQKKLEDEMKRQRKIEDWENHLQGKGYRSKYKPKDEENDATSHASGALPKKTGQLRRRDMSSLLDDDDTAASSGRWRPSRRSGPSGGGGG